MGIFGRKRRSGASGSSGRHAARSGQEDPVTESAPEYEDIDEEADAEPPRGDEGPFDVAEAPDDQLPRIDLGSVQVPVPDGAQVQVEMDPESGGVRAVHVLVPQGQVTVSAYAAPRSGGLWAEVCADLTEQLRSDGAKVSAGSGEWGRELSALVNDVALRFVGVDGPRWMLRGVIAGPQAHAAEAPTVLRDIMRGTVVNRGDSPLPRSTPLPITLPDAVAEHVAEQQAQQGG